MRLASRLRDLQGGARQSVKISEFDDFEVVNVTDIEFRLGNNSDSVMKNDLLLIFASPSVLATYLEMLLALSKVPQGHQYLDAESQSSGFELATPSAVPL
jgi:hypothetical protein